MREKKQITRSGGPIIAYYSPSYKINRSPVRLPPVHLPPSSFCAAVVGDRYPPGPLEYKKASREALGLLPCKAIPSWAGTELLAEWADT